MRKEPLFETLKDLVYKAATEVNDTFDRRRGWGTAHKDVVTPCIDKVRLLSVLPLKIGWYLKERSLSKPIPGASLI